MTRWILFAGVVLLGVAAVVISERSKVEAQASPAALLYLVADTEQELTRMPVNFARMSDSDEIRIGDEIATAYGTPGTSDTNKEEVRTVEEYLKHVGEPLASKAHRRLPYRFHYIPTQYMINAFALPGGHVYVGAGLLALMDTEDELAAVLGHEIEHVDHYHCAERAQQEQALRRIPLGGLVAIPVFVFEAGYSKDQELEADREGTRLAVEAGYSPNGAMRMFETFDRMYQRYRAQNRSRAGSPQEEVSDVAMQTLEGYFRSHPLPSERIAQIQKMIATEGWPTRAEKDLAVAYMFWTAQAESALNVKKYHEAEQIAARSVKVHPESSGAWEVLARAQFAQAEFAAAADSYRQLLDRDSTKRDDVEGYAMSLAASDRHTAAGQFRGWMQSLRTSKPRNAEVEQAGLGLLAGDEAAANRYEDALRVSGDPWAPDYLGELGWFYYLAGDYSHAAQLLSEAVQQRPGDMNLWTRRAWSEIELRRYSDSIQTVNNGALAASGVVDQRLQTARGMVLAVAFWQAREPGSALSEFDRATTGQPEFGDPNWVKALYSPLVAQAVQEMKAERERQKKQRIAEKR
jgi:predicted Zn-dependent protease